jgi:hypothetical protein
LIVGVSIEKATLFRGAQQPFANVYYYEAPLSVSDTGAWDDLINGLVTIEKTHHATDVNFVRGRLWKADGTKAENVMLIDKTLTGTGAVASSTTMDRERAILIQIRAGVDSRGRPVYNRKWFHFCASIVGGVGISGDAQKNTGTLTAGQQSSMAAVGESLKVRGIGVGGSTNATLTSKSGRDVTGAATCHPYLEHHQLGDQWRSV